MKIVALFFVTLLLIQNVAQAGIVDFLKRLLQTDDAVDTTIFDPSIPFNNNSGSSNGEPLTVPLCNIAPSINFLEPQVPLSNFDTLARDNNLYGLAFFKRLNETQSNIIIGALPDSLAGGLVYAGANGNTAIEIAKAFGYELTNTDIHQTFHQYLEKFTWDVMAGVNLVNTIWAPDDIVFSDAYNQILNNDYNTCVRQVDFFNRSEDVRILINGYVSNETNGTISELIPDGVIDNETNLLLVSALYFSNDWDIGFDSSMTNQVDFNLPNGSQVQIPMMHQNATSYPYYVGDGYQAIKLYFKDKLFALTIVLPDLDKFTDVAGIIDSSFIYNIFDNLQDTDVILSLPRFSISGRFSEASTLVQLGMVDAFNGSAADFSGMDGHRDLWLTDFISGCYFEVKESGVNMVQPGDSTNAITLTIDRPFFFLVHDEPGTAFFAGQFTTPASSAKGSR